MNYCLYLASLSFVRDFQEIKYPRKLTTEAQRTRRDEEERGLLYEVFGDFLI
jgi:hypothetical protein